MEILSRKRHLMASLSWRGRKGAYGIGCLNKLSRARYREQGIQVKKNYDAWNILMGRFLCPELTETAYFP
jgi:hypothetical protein